MSPPDRASVNDLSAGFRLGGDRIVLPRENRIAGPEGEVRVEPRVMDVLVCLADRAGEPVSRETLNDVVWGRAIVSDHALTNCVSELRAHLGDRRSAPRFIATIPKRGYRLVAPVEACRPVPAPALRDARSASVAVLPFLHLGGDPEGELFADGMTEEVIAQLARIRSLKVISRTSTMVFKQRDLGLSELGERLGAATLLEGSVRRAGNRVRIVAQLIEAASDEHLWAESYDRDLTDIFAIQSDVALSIARALRAELTTGERARARRAPTDDLEAYGLYLRGRASLARFTPEGYRRSLDDLGRAVALDPGFALAWASIAQVHAENAIEGLVDDSPEEAIRQARDAARRALELDGDLPEAHGIAGLIRFVFDDDWSGAERELRKAIELSPGSADLHDHYSWLLSSLERFDEALREVRRARDLDPLSTPSDVPTTLLRAGRVEEALEEARRSVEAEPASPRCHSILGWALFFGGRRAEGIAALERAVTLAPRSTLFLGQLGQARALAGEVGEARQILARLHDLARQQFVSPYHFAYVHAGLGEPDAAIGWLERARERRSGAIYGVKGSFLFRGLRGHPRFEALLRSMNLG